MRPPSTKPDTHTHTHKHTHWHIHTWQDSFIYVMSHLYVKWLLHMWAMNVYRMAKMHRMPYFHGSFSAKEPVAFLQKDTCNLRHPMHLRHPVCDMTPLRVWRWRYRMAKTHRMPGLAASGGTTDPRILASLFPTRNRTSQTSDFKSDVWDVWTDIWDVGSHQIGHLRRPIWRDPTSHTSDFKSDILDILVRFEIGRVRRPISQNNGKMRPHRIHHLHGLLSNPFNCSGTKAPPLAARLVAGLFPQKSH